ncbi:hypothetical protein SBOR_7319 [Sclerotinia borealis F-4128]|uniref:PLD phosphodiesterase domain-containing protein n=1 Tax=Sclerotinia borealis (strain F-4128) TaxID=1432307 RepID=W9CBQ9_SCLBF|nr:hypothetical protein SBOR_7319 [Sclerotinia borealis F-4128]
MSDSEFDEDLKRAIALSLGQTSSSLPTREKSLIDLTVSDDDDDLDAPVASHFKFAQADPIHNTSTDEKVGTSSRVPSQPSSTVLNGLNRKQMEVERIARVQYKSRAPDAISKKRKASISSPASSPGERRQPKASRLEATLSREADDDDQNKSTDRNSTSGGTGRALDRISSGFTERDPETGTSVITENLPRDTKPGSVSGIGVQFPHGVVKKTWADGFPREDDIKIEEVLQSADLTHALLSAFQIEPDWIISKISPGTKVIWVLQAKNESEKLNYQSLAPKTFRFCFPSMEGNVDCMHSKLQLLAHPTHLRLVIPSANLTPYDWGESGGIVENVVFLIDLPRLSDGEKASDDQTTPFSKELFHFLGAMGLPPKTLESFRNFDYSNTNHLALVHSIGGSHFGPELQRTGYPGLGRSVSSLGLETDQPLELDFLTASIGNLDDRFLRTIYLASQGDNGYKEYKWRTEKPTRSKTETLLERQLSEEIGRRFRVYFPSKQTVIESKGGTDAAGTVCFRSKWYDATSFPRSLMRDCQSCRKGLLMHNKMLFVRSQKTQESPRPIAWAYVGSANLSESAWQVLSVFILGRMVKDRATKEPKLNCRNWECGVLFSIPATDLNALAAVTKLGIPAMDAFHGSIPVPMVFPSHTWGSRFYETCSQGRVHDISTPDFETLQRTSLPSIMAYVANDEEIHSRIMPTP